MSDYREQAEKALREEGRNVSPDIMSTVIEQRAKKLRVEAEKGDTPKADSAEQAPVKEEPKPTKEPKPSEGDNPTKDDKPVDDGLKQKLEEYEKQLKTSKGIEEKYEYLKSQIKEKQPKIDERLAKAQKLVDDGMDLNVAIAVVSTNVDEISNLEAVKLKYKLDNPTYAKHDSIVEREVLKAYGVDDIEDLEGDDKFNIDANAAKGLLRDKTSIDASLNFGLPEDIDAEFKKGKEESEAKIKAQKEAWSDFAEKSFKPNFKSLPVLDVSGEKLFDFELSEDDVNRYTEEFVNTVGASEINEDNAKSAYSFMQMRALTENFPKIVKAANDRAIASYQEAEDKSKTNPRQEKSEVRENNDARSKAQEKYDAQLRDKYGI